MSSDQLDSGGDVMAQESVLAGKNGSDADSHAGRDDAMQRDARRSRLQRLKRSGKGIHEAQRAMRASRKLSNKISSRSPDGRKKGSIV